MFNVSTPILPQCDFASNVLSFLPSPKWACQLKLVHMIYFILLVAPKLKMELSKDNSVKEKYLKIVSHNGVIKIIEDLMSCLLLGESSVIVFAF